MADGGHLDTHHKALRLNLDPTVFGAFAEIGAGQEVARWFLRVGAASGTVAKTVSAYDMKVSDDLYGATTRYVSRERLEEMLAREWELLLRQLESSRGPDTRFFVFADTVSARNFSGTNECHGWMGVRYQPRPNAEPQEVVLHVNLLDDTNVLQQEALGILGVNLIYAAFDGETMANEFPGGLFDQLGEGRIEVDFAACRGPAFAGMDPRHLLVALLHHGRAEAVALPAAGRLVPPTELLHGRPVLIEPGRFAAVEPVFRAMLDAGLKRLDGEDTPEQKRPPVALCALSIAGAFAGTARLADAPSLAHESLDPREILQRVDRLQAAGFDVLAFRRRELYRMSELVRRFTEASVRFVIGVSTLIDVLCDNANEALEGALLEALSRLFGSHVRVYVYPMRADNLRQRLEGSAARVWVGERDPAAMVAADTIQPPPPHCHLHRYLLDTGFIVPLRI